MSKTGAIILEISFIDKNIFENIFIDLLDDGWIAKHDDGIAFMVDGSYEWRNIDNKNFDEVFKLVSDSIDRGLETCIDIAWSDSKHRLGMTYVNSKKIMFTLNDEEKKIENLGLPDFTWYLLKLKSVFGLINFTRLVCLYN